MKIKTKFNIDDTVYFMQANKVCSGKIHRIIIKREASINNEKDIITDVLYAISHYNINFYENRIFANIEELFKNL